MREIGKGLAFNKLAVPRPMTKSRAACLMARSLVKAFTCWPLKTRYGFRDVSGAKSFVENAWRYARIMWKAEWHARK